MIKVLNEFYYPFQEALKAAETNMQRVPVPTNETCNVCGAPMVVKFGKSGQFLGCSKYRVQGHSPLDSSPAPRPWRASTRAPSAVRS